MIKALSATNRANPKTAATPPFRISFSSNVGDHSAAGIRMIAATHTAKAMLQIVGNVI